MIVASAPAQSTPAVTWQTIVSANGEFSIAVPGTLVINKNSRLNSTEIVGGAGGAGFALNFRKTSRGDDFIDRLLLQPEKRGVESSFEIGTAAGRIYTYESQKIYRSSVSLATKKAYYYLSITAPDARNDVLNSVLASMRIDGRQVLNNLKVQPPEAVASVNVKDLKISDVVREALKRKQTDRVTAVSAPEYYEPPGSDTVFSRPVLVVRNTPATFSTEARNNMISGAVRLWIQLKANGNVGKIVVLKGLPYGLTEQSIRAASEIKFVPAEVEGKPADAFVTREYTFQIY